MDDITWKDQGTPADHARNVDTIATLVAGMGLYNVASELAVAAQCITGLDEETAALRAETHRLREALNEIGNAQSCFAAEDGIASCTEHGVTEWMGMCSTCVARAALAIDRGRADG